MPDLGKYGDTVLGAYAVSALLIVLLVLVSLWRAARVNTQLRKLEERMRSNG